MKAPPSAQPRTGVPKDVWLALGVAVLAVLGSAVSLQDDLWASLPDLAGPLIPHPTELFFLLAGSLPLALRRVAPLAVLAVCGYAWSHESWNEGAFLTRLNWYCA